MRRSRLLDTHHTNPNKIDEGRDSITQIRIKLMRDGTEKVKAADKEQRVRGKENGKAEENKLSNLQMHCSCQESIDWSRMGERKYVHSKPLPQIANVH